ncbi:MAG: tyrosine-type recombinase/integrase [Gemmataceae bacterium]
MPEPDGVLWRRQAVAEHHHLAKATRPTGWKSCNLRTTFGKLVKRAGLEAWPRLFHNLRSSRETELLEEFPVHVVAMWMGHDAKVSLKHYAQTTDEHFERATRAAESDAPALQKAVQQAAVASGRDSQTKGVNGDGVATCATPCESPRHTAHAFSGEGGSLTMPRRKCLLSSLFRCKALLNLDL